MATAYRSLEHVGDTTTGTKQGSDESGQLATRAAEEEQRGPEPIRPEPAGVDADERETEEAGMALRSSGPGMLARSRARGIGARLKERSGRAARGGGHGHG